MQVRQSEVHASASAPDRRGIRGPLAADERPLAGSHDPTSGQCVRARDAV